ncbi:hypothetical protein MRS44_005104 [Fusarium solani]|uniref:uncharacterized protein n=1 Tax=Fusarium solani TaxID=169388 RepID=UPI0032C495BE|nr:hypothetical protein MRS44_005104 [Fusarium solani]
MRRNGPIAALRSVVTRRTLGQVHEIVTLYLRQVYTHLSNEIPKLVKSDPTFSRHLRLKNWNSLAIDFIFSTPTTWQAPVSQHFRGIVSKAGFGEQKLHSVMLGLTEADASAVFTCQPWTVGKDSYSHEGLGIREGSLYFTRRQLESCFDIALQEIKGLIKDALGNFEGNNRGKGIVRHVNSVVLSGGLGSSDYVLKELTTAEGDARTAVVKGLLYDRRTKVRALGEHKARANYGIIVEEPQSEGPTLNENTKRYPSDTTVFATDRIRWLIKFGETIQVGEPTTVKITKRLEKSEQWKWTEKIVWLKGTGSFLPANVKDGCELGMEELHSADIEVRSGEKLSAGKRSFWRKSGYDKCDFKLMLVVGPSGDCDVKVSKKVIKRSE